MSSFDAIENKMQAVGLSAAAINAFRHSVQVLESKQSMLIPEGDIVPAEGVADWEQLVAVTPAAEADLLAQSVLIKLNGGLGTSMGLQKAKSLLEIKPGVTFLDLIVSQVKSLRAAAGYPVNLLLMNSFSTSEDTMAHLARYAEDGFADPETEKKTERELRLIKDMGVKLDLLFNGNCYGDEAISNKLSDTVR